MVSTVAPPPVRAARSSSSAAPEQIVSRSAISIACLFVAVGAGAGVTVRPKLTVAICAALAVMVWVAARPALAGYLVIGVTPLVAGIDRGHVVPVLRPSEALALLVGAVLAARALIMWRSGAARTPRLSPVEWAIVAMAVCNSVVPMIWMVARREPITQDDILYALVLWKYAGIYLIVKTSIRTRAQVARCLWLAIGSGAAVAVIAILQSLHLFGVPALLASYYAPFGYTGALEHARGSSTLALPAATADLMILCLAITAGMWRKLPRRRVLLSAAAALFAMGALAAGEFSSAIGLIVGICALALITNYPRLLSLLVPLAGAAVIFLRPVIAARLSGFDSVSGLPVSWTGRLHNLQSYFWPKLFSDWNYLFGVRPSARVPVSYQATGYVWIESGYTWLLWGGGIPLLIAFFYFARTTLRMGWQGFYDDGGPPGVAALAVFVIVTVICVVMIFDPHLTYRGIAEEFYALLALAGMAVTRRRPTATAKTIHAAPGRR
jgi:hypothetical protein